MPHATGRILVYTRTLEFRHESIPAGITAIRELGAAVGLAVDATEEPGVFASAALARYAGVVFLRTSGDVLDGAGKAAFEAYVRDGGGFLGIQSTAATAVPCHRT